MAQLEEATWAVETEGLWTRPREHGGQHMEMGEENSQLVSMHWCHHGRLR